MLLFFVVVFFKLHVVLFGRKGGALKPLFHLHLPLWLDSTRFPLPCSGAPIFAPMLTKIRVTPLLCDCEGGGAFSLGATRAHSQLSRGEERCAGTTAHAPSVHPPARSCKIYFPEDVEESQVRCQTCVWFRKSDSFRDIRDRESSRRPTAGKLALRSNKNG